MEMTAEHAHEPRPRAPLIASVQTWILGLIGSMAIGAFAFLWNLNATIVQIKEQSIARDRSIDILQNSVNSIGSDLKETKGNVQEVKERTIRLEDAQNAAKNK